MAEAGILTEGDRVELIEGEIIKRTPNGMVLTDQEQFVDFAWPEATKKRRLLAFFIDYLLFGAPWTLVVWFLSMALRALIRSLSILRVSLLSLSSCWRYTLPGGLQGYPFSVYGTSVESKPQFLLKRWYKD